MKNKPLVGAFFCFAFLWSPAGCPAGPTDKALIPKPRTLAAVITIDQNNTCAQDVGGILTAFPDLRALESGGFAGDTIEWKGKDAKGNDATVVVKFPAKTPNGNAGTPFSSNGTPAFTFTSGQNSGPASNAILGDFSFESVTVGGAKCSNGTFGGVHVTK